ncbi:NAD(P)-binding domain-containing protein [Dehalococcoidales bacterium]|nr:NAD(P)-binding domain-containing protein [Dehalococcoidales bacterium]
MPKIAIIGTTTWGTTLGVVLADKGLWVKLWARTEEEATALRNAESNPALFSGITFPSRLSITSSLSEVLAGVKAIILAVPSQTMRQNIKLVTSYLKRSILVVSAAKGSFPLHLKATQLVN